MQKVNLSEAISVTGNIRSGTLESLIISFNAIVPMFLIIAIGYTFKSIGWITPAEVKRFNKIVFHTFMPAMLFRSIYNSDLSKLMDPGYLILCWFQ